MIWIDQPVVEVARDSRGNLQIGDAEIEVVKAAARANSMGRARINAHPSLASDTHEMMIAFVRGSYVRPHRHTKKRESFHVIHGCLEALTFDDRGKVTDRVELGTYGSGLPFYFRSESNDWHSFVVRSDIAIVHETTQGPFEPGESDFPAWAPDPSDVVAVRDFLSRLIR